MVTLLGEGWVFFGVFLSRFVVHGVLSKDAAYVLLGGKVLLKIWSKQIGSKSFSKSTLE